MLSSSCALGVDRVQERDDRLVPAFEDRVDLGVGRIERLGGGEDRLALTLEALGEAVAEISAASAASAAAASPSTTGRRRSVRAAS